MFLYILQLTFAKYHIETYIEKYAKDHFAKVGPYIDKFAIPIFSLRRKIFWLIY